MLKFMLENATQNYWDIEVARWQQCELHEPIKGQALKAISCLRSELGEDFLANVIVPNPTLNFPNPNHPIYNTLAYISDWNAKSLVSLAEMINKLKLHSIGYKKIIDKLKKPERYLEGLSILNTAYKFLKAGFYIEIEPNVNNKTPDLRITDRENGVAILLEVTVLGRSRSLEQSVATSQKIIKYLEDNGQGINANIKIYTLLSEDDLTEVITNGMPNAIAKARSTEMVQKYSLNQKLDATLTPHKDQTRSGITINGPPYSTPEVGRLIGRIKEKYKGLPEEYPKIIVIQANFLLLSDYSSVISELEATVNNLPELLFVAIINEYIGAREEEIREVLGVNKYIKRINDLDHERDFILVNNKCQIVIPEATQKKLDIVYDQLSS